MVGIYELIILLPLVLGVLCALGIGIVFLVRMRSRNKAARKCPRCATPQQPGAPFCSRCGAANSIK
jgi:hypothetical protein